MLALPNHKTVKTCSLHNLKYKLWHKNINSSAMVFPQTAVTGCAW